MTIAFNLYPNGIESGQRFGSSQVNAYSSAFETPGVEVFVESQVPSFVREDHPRFVEFLKSYYTWLDHNRNIGEKIRKLKDHQDIDLADPHFAEQFYKEFLSIVPRNVLADKRLLVKYIRQFYRAKGTEKSYRFFFRMLLNTSVDFYYPVKDILKVSDGKWVKDICLRVIPISGNGADFQFSKIVSKQSRISARVDLVRKIRSDFYSGYELVLNTSSINGQFLPDEIIQTEDGSAIARISPLPTRYSFTFDATQGKYKTGSGYKVGDTFKIINKTGRGSRLRVASIIKNQRTILETIVTPTEDDVENSIGKVREIFLGNKNVFSVISIICANDNGQYVAEPTMNVDGVSPSGIVHENVKERYQLSQNEDGDVYLKLLLEYESYVPQGRVRVVFDYLVEDESGQIDKLDVINFGLEYRTYDDPSKRTFNIQLNEDVCVTKNFTGSGAEIQVQTTALGIYPGYYANEDGQLSSSKKIQDGEYYQQYSYVTITDKPVSEYKEHLKSVIHPAGLKFFGQFRQQNLISARIKTTSKGSIVRREFKQFPRPTKPGTQAPLHSEPTVRTSTTIHTHLTKDTYAAGHGPSVRSIFRERFDYSPTKKYDPHKDFNNINSEYWMANLANTSINKFKNMIPITIEGVSSSVQDELPQISDYLKYAAVTERGVLIYNTTKRIVELYDGSTWIEVNPNMRINILPDAVVSTTGIMIEENGDTAVKLTSVRSTEMLGNHKITAV